MDTTQHPTICAVESNQYLSMLIDKHPAEVSLDERQAQRYLQAMSPNIKINTITKGRFLWDGTVNKDYFAIFQSYTAMIAVRIDHLGNAKLECPGKFWVVDEYIGHSPRECLAAFLNELSEVMDWSKTSSKEQRILASSLLSSWEYEAFLHET